MTLQTSLDISPYWDDYDPTKQYYRVLFKPGVAVQTRELNQIQSMLQNQIERFGDNIFEEGTIIQGCNFTFYDYYPYVKLLDNTIAGSPALVGDYICKFAVNSANLTAFIVGANSGYQSQNPNLNTLYIRYINSGNTGNLTNFAPGDILTIYDSNNSVFGVDVNSGSVGFSNTDTVVLLSALVVNVSSTNTFANGELITQATTGAQAVIVGINTTAVANNLVLQIAPTKADLTNNSINSTSWTFNTGYNINSNTTNSVANVSAIVGSGASATLLTDGLGVVNDISMITQGFGYIIPPYATIKTFSNGNISQLSLSAQNYEAMVTVANTSNNTGTGYAFGVSEGWIYQKGFFLYVLPQTIVVSKYNNIPDGVSVGFITTESFVNSNSDSTLLDNASGAPNFNAPGADRLSLAPSLTVANTINLQSNSSFFILTSFAEGQPFFQNQQTDYGQIGQEMAQCLYDQSGNFVVEPFLITTDSPSNVNNESNTFTLTIGPGDAYVSGKRVQTTTNYNVQVPKATNTSITTQTINLNYGGYIEVANVTGFFQFSTGDLINLQDTAAGVYANASDNYAPVKAGNTIGQARLKSVDFDNGTPGTSNGMYRVYLFDIVMNQGKNLNSVRSLFYQGATANGVADVITTLDLTTNTNICQLSNADTSSLLFNIANTMIKNANNIDYITRVQNYSLTANTSGMITITLSTTGWTWPYTANAYLTTQEASQITIIPSVTIDSSNLNAGANSTSGSNLVSISANNATNLFLAGDFISVGANLVGQISSVVNSTTVQLVSNAPSTSAGNVSITFPAWVPINITRASRSVNVDNTGKILTINLGNTTLTANSTVYGSYNVQVSNAAVVSKVSNRNTVVKLYMSNNSANTVGPWALGVPDIYRLKHVFMDSNTANLSTSSTEVTNEFYIDNNQNPNYLDMGYLYLTPGSNLALSSQTALMVVFDCFTAASNGIFSFNSYPVNDTVANLASLSIGTTINSLEIPEVKSPISAAYYDLINCIDFRPYTVNTATITANSSLATINPPSTNVSSAFGNTSNVSAVLYFPTPDSVFSATVEQYLPRIDRVLVTSNNNFVVLEGQPSLTNLVAPSEPANTMTINLLYVPAFPTVTFSKSLDFSQIVDTKIASETLSFQRLANNSIAIPLVNNSDLSLLQPSRYTMRDISYLERRLAALEKLVSISSLQPQTVSSNNVVAYLVDDFSSYSFTDVNNPEYKATIDFANEVVPINSSFNIEYMFNTANSTTEDSVVGKSCLLPFNEVPLLAQPYATELNDVFCPCGCNTNSNSILQQTTLNILVVGGSEVQENQYLFSNTSGSVVLFYNFHAQNSNVNIQIYQGNTQGFSIANLTPIATLTANRVAATNTQIINYYSFGGTQQLSWQVNGGLYFGAIPFTNTPTNGQYYEVVITAPNGVNFDYLLSYPADSFVNTQLVASATTSMKHIGTMEVFPETFSILTQTIPAITSITQLPNLTTGT